MQRRNVMLNSEIPGIFSGRTPFENSRLSRSYMHFFTLSNAGGKRLAFASAEDYREEGSVIGHWIPIEGKWEPIQEALEIEVLFDKLGGDVPLFNRTIEHAMSRALPVFGPYGLNRFTGDKWECYRAYSREHALTGLLEPTPATIPEQIGHFFKQMDDVYEQHDNVAVIKPRWGWESRGLYLVVRDEDELRLLTLNQDQVRDPGQVSAAVRGFATIPYIIQAWVDTREGIPELGLQAARHDARFIFSITARGQCQFVQAYVKTPARMLYFPIEMFPRAAIELTEQVADGVSQSYGYGIFSVDIMRDRSGRWFVTELNDQIGFNIDFADRLDIEGVGLLMRRYLDEIYWMEQEPNNPRYQIA